MSRRFLRHNKSMASPGAFIFFDTETLPTPVPDDPDAHLHTLRLGVAHYVRLERGKETREDRLKFTSTQQFWQWVFAKLHPRIPTWIWTHNVGFDLTVCDFWRMLGDGEFIVTDPDQEDGGERAEGRGKGWGKGFMLLNDPPTVISGKVPGKGRFVVCDTMNYFVTSLAKMGKQLGRDKMPMPAFEAPDSEWFPYCENDVLILRECVLGLVRWVKEQELGRFRYTAPAQAMGAYRHRFMKWGIEYHDESDVRSLERQCYYGGRLEAFFIGRCHPRNKRRILSVVDVKHSSMAIPRCPVYELDVCSLYPAVMREHEYPSKLVDSSFESGLRPDWKDTLAGDCAALVRLRSDVGFPQRTKALGTIYPVGEYWTCLCGPELQRALDLDVVTDCAAWSRYHLAPIFDDFVDYFWAERRRYELENNNLYATMCKLMLNGLYGKFGQKSADWVDRPDIEPPQQWGPWISEGATSGVEREFRIIGGNVQEKVPEGELFNTSPAIAAWVTAHGRETMREFMRVAGARNVLYCVTDALVVTQAGYDRLERAGAIGDRVLGKLGLKCRGTTCKIGGLHHVQIGKHVKRGSVKPNAKRIGRHTWRETQFQHLREILKGREAEDESAPEHDKHFPPPKIYLPPLAGVLVYPQDKEMIPRYTRGTVTPSGWVKPLVLSDERTSDVAIAEFLSGASVCGVGPG